MSEPQIGQWVRRSSGSGAYAQSKWHLAESIVAGDVVTRCGRRMRDSLPFQVSAVMPLTRLIGQPQLCRRCAPAAVEVSGGSALEDDASTHGETVP